VYVDSCAAASVAPLWLAGNTPIDRTVLLDLVTATGGDIHEEGCCVVFMKHVVSSIVFAKSFQITSGTDAVRCPLMSLGECESQGFDVVMYKGTYCMYLETGESLPFYKENQVYYMPVTFDVTPSERNDALYICNVSTDETAKSVIRTLPSPVKPPQAEIDLHESQGHVPFRSWCRWCVRGKARELPHLNLEKTHDITTYHSDYGFIGEKDDSFKLITLNLYDDISKDVQGTAVPAKGVVEEFGYKWCVEAFRESGLTKVLWKLINEPVIWH